jgi:hypothetical protein
MDRLISNAEVAEVKNAEGDVFVEWPLPTSSPPAKF